MFLIAISVCYGNRPGNVFTGLRVLKTTALNGFFPDPMAVLSSCTFILLTPYLVFSTHPPTYYKFHPNPAGFSEVPKHYSHHIEWFVQRE